MNQKVYFAGSIRGGQDDIQLYHDMIEYINKYRFNRTYWRYDTFYF